MTMEIGKKYTHNRETKGIWQCVGAYKNKFWIVCLRDCTGRDRTDDVVIVPDFPEDYVEYVEPKVEKFVRHLSRSVGTTDGFMTYQGDVYNLNDLVGSVEFTITDGKLTNVEIVE